MAIPYAPSTSSILCPGASVTIAFFQSARRPSERPIRFSFPSNEAVRTDETLTLNTVSTATRISTLFASGRTRNATVFCSSFCRMLFSVMSGRMRISRAVRLIGAGSSRPARTAGSLLSALDVSSRQRLLEGQKARALAHHAMGVQQLVDGYVRRRLDGEPGYVARRAHHGPVQLAHDEERRLTGHPKPDEPADQRLRLPVADVERLDRGQLAGGDLGRDGLAKRLAPHRARHILVVAPRRRAERLAPALPLDGPRRALPSPAEIGRASCR